MAAEIEPSAIGAPHAPVQLAIARLQAQYQAKDTKLQDEIIALAYASTARFEDNIAVARGVKGIQLQFHAVAKFFKSCVFTPQSAEVSVKEDGGYDVKLVDAQEYQIGKRELKFVVDTSLELNSAGQIVQHKDVWRDSYESWGLVKRTFGPTTSLLYRVFGV